MLSQEQKTRPSDESLHVENHTPAAKKNFRPAVIWPKVQQLPHSVFEDRMKITEVSFRLRAATGDGVYSVPLEKQEGEIR